MLYTLNLYSVVCQFYLNKAGWKISNNKTQVNFCTKRKNKQTNKNLA